MSHWMAGGYCPTVPRAGRVAQPVVRVGDPVLALLRDGAHLEDAHLAVLGGEGVGVARGVELLDARLAVVDHAVEEALLHHRRRVAALVEAELRARGVARADV